MPILTGVHCPGCILVTRAPFHEGSILNAAFAVGFNRGHGDNKKGSVVAVQQKNLEPPVLGSFTNFGWQVSQEEEELLCLRCG